MEVFKKVGAYAILGVIVTGLLTFVPPIFQASSFVFGLGTKYSSMMTIVEGHSISITNHSSQINGTKSDIKEFRSVWCYDRLASSSGVSPYVLKACSEWIKGP